jgi:two-component system, NarL family, nitrate/nitrite response regulator NarL
MALLVRGWRLARAVPKQKSSRPTTVLVAEDHPLMLEALIRHLDGEPDLAVVAIARDGPELVAQFERHRPDIVLTEYWLPSYTGASATKRIKKLDPGARVVFFSGSDDPRLAAACVEAGALAFVPKSNGASELLEHLRAAATTGDPIPHPNPSTRPPPTGVGKRSLTTREREVLRLIADGHTNGSVGEHLYLSPETVKTHVRRIYKKLGVSDRASAVRVALVEGLIA